MRQIILASPVLWNHVYIDHRGSFQLAHLWLQRSATVPLAVTIRMVACQQNSLSPSFAIFFQNNGQKFLASIAHRIRTFSIIAGWSMLTQITSDLSTLDLPLLKALTLGADRLLHRDGDSHLTCDVPIQTWSLKTLRLLGAVPTKNPDCTIWSQLTSLVLRPPEGHKYYLTAQFYQMLSEFQALQDLVLDTMLSARDLPNGQFQGYRSPIVTLPELRTMDLRIPSGIIAHILTQLYTPRLQVRRPPIAFASYSDKFIREFMSPRGIKAMEVDYTKDTTTIAAASMPTKSGNVRMPDGEFLVTEKVRNVLKKEQPKRHYRTFAFVTSPAGILSYQDFIDRFASFAHVDSSSLQYQAEDPYFKLDTKSGRLMRCPTETQATISPELFVRTEAREGPDWLTRLSYAPEVPGVFVFIGVSDGKEVIGSFVDGEVGVESRKRDALIIKERARGWLSLSD